MLLNFIFTSQCIFKLGTVKGPSVKAPIQIFGLEGRYAHALYSAAVKSKKEALVEENLKSFSSLLKQNSQLQEFVNDPTLQRKEKQEKLNDILVKQNFDKLTVNFFELLTDNNRLPRFGGITGAYSQIMGASRGEVACTVTCVEKLDPASSKALETALKGFLAPNEVIKLDIKVDPSILGGLIVELKEKYIDMSTATKIRKLTNVLKQAI